MKKILFTILLAFATLPLLAQDPYVMCEDTCEHIHGLDMSRYQGEVFWDAVGNNSKMMYVYLKATEGRDHVDVKYKHNIEMAHAAGLKVGSYHFYRPLVPQHLQLQNFMAQCRPADQDLIPMIDIEVMPKGMSVDAFCDSLLTFIGLVEHAYRQKPLLYTYTNFYNRYLVGKLDGYPLMIAQYTAHEPRLADERDITMWQYTGKGRISGVNTYVDKSRFMGKHGMREIRFRHRGR